MKTFVTFLMFTASHPATAEGRMDAATFDAYVTGRTVTWGFGAGFVHGIERYMDGRRVMWSSETGICQYGVWFESKGDICFRYDGDPARKCWAISHTPDGLRAIYTSQPSATEIHEMTDRDDTLICRDLSS